MKQERISKNRTSNFHFPYLITVHNLNFQSKQRLDIKMTIKNNRKNNSDIMNIDCIMRKNSLPQ